MAIKASASITLSFMVDIQATYRYYKLQSSTASAPSTPTAWSELSVPSGWTDTEPSYTSGSTNILYFVDCTVFTNGSFLYSKVSRSSSYEAAKEAYNKAVAAESSASDANDKIDNLEIGGRNLIVGTNSEWTAVSVGANYTILHSITTDELKTVHGLVDGDKLTYSIFLKSDSERGVKIRWQKYNSSSDRVSGIGSTLILNSEKKQSITLTFDESYSRYDLMIQNGNTSISGGVTEYYKCVKLEKGTVPTDWTPAPEDAVTALEDFSSVVTTEIESLQSQIDGNITTWFYDYDPSTSNAPASSWTTDDLKNQHLGDLFYIVNNTDKNGQVYRWALVSGAYQWIIVEDADVTKALADAKTAQDTADGKRRVFTSEPVPPYDVGDLWTQGSGGELMVCTTAKASGSYSLSHWSKASKYTDDSAVNNLEIGGRNLLLDGNEITLSNTNYTNTNTREPHKITVTSDSRGDAYIRVEKRLSISTSELAALTRTYTFSIDVKTTGLTVPESTVTFDFRTSSHTKLSRTVIDIPPNQNGEWMRLSGTWSVEKDADRVNAVMGIYFPAGCNGVIIEYRNPKLEFGNKATAWTAAPEEVANDISGVEAKADAADVRIGDLESSVGIISEQLSALVSDVNGVSFMQQTGSGWELSLGGIIEQIENIQKTLGTLDSLLDSGNSDDSLSSLLSRELQTLAGLNSSRDKWDTTSEHVQVGTWEDHPCVFLRESDTSYRLAITNQMVLFLDGENVMTTITNTSVFTNNISIKGDIKQSHPGVSGYYVWAVRSNGNYGLQWKEGEA